METYIVRQPIQDQKNEVIGYEILYQQEASGLSPEKDTKAAGAIEDFLLQLDNDKFLGGKTAFLTFTPNLLIKNIPKMFSPNKLVIQIEDSSLVHPLARKIIHRYKKQGYRIALQGFSFSPRYFDILEVLDIIKLDFSNLEDSSLQNIVNVGSSFQKEIVAYNVNTEQAMAKAKELHCHYIQGTFVAQQLPSKVHRMDHMQSNFFQLVVAITRDEPNVDEITMIISRDVTLAFSLIKLVNSAYFALRNRAKSVKQALIILGLGQLKQWIYLLSFKQNGEMPEELVKISFLRAHFCSELSQYVNDLPISKSEAYLMGMFSTLGILMEVPLESALEELAISEEVKNALLHGEGICGDLYQLVLCYENADWKGMTQYAQRLGIPMNVITQKYFECVEYVNQIWNDLMVPYEEQGTQEEAEPADDTEEAFAMNKE
ncbi:MAG: HDOD domain-containing protein [Provencibacterium sp.]|jgi:EAL and modified HD-GYP domain-containing signal transduction protein|nr:HDOD domain-containing protein [Provencibacterium sp.]